MLIKRKSYYIFGVIGLLLMITGQVLARPRFYGSAPGRAWAHVFWLGFLLLVGLFIKYIAQHPNPLVVKMGKRQLVGIFSIIYIVTLFGVVSVLGGNTALTADDGDARRGLLVLWLGLTLVFTVTNLFILVVHRIKSTK